MSVCMPKNPYFFEFKAESLIEPTIQDFTIIETSFLQYY